MIPQYQLRSLQFSFIKRTPEDPVSSALYSVEKPKVVICISNTFQQGEKKTTKSNIKSSGNFPYLMNTYNTSIFLYFSFTNKLVLRKEELYRNACSHNLALWQPGSSQSRRGHQGAGSQLFEGQRQNPNLLGFLGRQGIFRIV